MTDAAASEAVSWRVPVGRENEGSGRELSDGRRVSEREEERAPSECAWTRCVGRMTPKTMQKGKKSLTERRDGDRAPLNED